MPNGAPALSNTELLYIGPFSLPRADAELQNDWKHFSESNQGRRISETIDRSGAAGTPFERDVRVIGHFRVGR